MVAGHFKKTLKNEIQKELIMKQKQRSKARQDTGTKPYTFRVALSVAGHEFRHEFTPLEYQSYGIKEDKNSNQWREEVRIWGTDACLTVCCNTKRERHRITKAIDNESLSGVRCGDGLTSVALTVYMKGWPHQSSGQVLTESHCMFHGSNQSVRVFGHKDQSKSFSLCAAGYYLAAEIAEVFHEYIKTIKVEGPSLLLESKDLVKQAEILLTLNSPRSAQKLAAALRARTVHTIAINEHVAGVMVNPMRATLPMRYYTAACFRRPERHPFVELGATFASHGYKKDGPPCYLIQPGKLKQSPLSALALREQSSDKGARRGSREVGMNQTKAKLASKGSAATETTPGEKQRS